MTHFTVAVIVPQDQFGNIHGFIARQMAPYDENTPVEPYVCYSVEQAAADIEREKSRLAQVLRRQEPGYDLAMCRESLAELGRTTPEQKYRERLRFHDSFNNRGEPESTWNPQSKWDWYAVGGRWDGWVHDRDARSEDIGDNLATTEEVLARDKITHAIITPDGAWHERGRLGWWAVLLSDDEDWDRVARDILARHPGHRVVILDAHI